MEKTQYGKDIIPRMDVSEWASDIRFQIWALLTIYHELSFSQLAEKLGKAKSTIHPHLQRLIELGIIKISRKEPVRANIVAHYYTLKPGHEEKMMIIGKADQSEKINKEFLQKVAGSFKSLAMFNKMILEKYIELLTTLEDSENIEELWKELFKIDFNQSILEEAFNNIQFLTESQWKRLQKKIFQLFIDFEKECIKEWNKNPNEERSFYFLASGIPIKNIFEQNKLGES